MRLLEGHLAPVLALAYAPDGRILASGGQHGVVKLWDPFTGSQIRTLVPQGYSTAVTSLAFSPDGQIVAAGRQGGSADLWSTVTGGLIRRHNLDDPHTYHHEPTAIAFNHDGQRFVAGFQGHAVEWLGQTDRQLRTLTPTIRYPVMWPIHRVAYSPGGALAIGDRNIVSVWPTGQAKTAHVINWPAGAILGLAFSPLGEPLAVARGSEVGLFFFDEERNRYRRSQVLRHSEIVRAIAFPADGRTLLTAGDDWTVHAWDTGTGQERNSFNWRLGPILALAVAPDGMTGAVSGRDKSAILIVDLE